jgi:hypothetical protein
VPWYGASECPAVVDSALGAVPCRAVTPLTASVAVATDASTVTVKMRECMDQVLIRVCVLRPSRYVCLKLATARHETVVRSSRSA